MRERYYYYSFGFEREERIKKVKGKQSKWGEGGVKRRETNPPRIYGTNTYMVEKSY